MAKKLEITRKLPPKFKAKWLAALRSGKFKQGQHLLCFEYTSGAITHCCLGVACATAGASNELMKGAGVPLTLASRKPSYRKKLPVILLEPKFHYIVKKLMVMNDDEGCSFKEIANWIEKNL